MHTHTALLKRQRFARWLCSCPLLLLRDGVRQKLLPGDAGNGIGAHAPDSSCLCDRTAAAVTLVSLRVVWRGCPADKRVLEPEATLAQCGVVHLSTLHLSPSGDVYVTPSPSSRPRHIHPSSQPCLTACMRLCMGRAPEERSDMVSQEELCRAVVVTGIPSAPQEVTDTAIYDAFAPFGLIERVIMQRCVHVRTLAQERAVPCGTGCALTPTYGVALCDRVRRVRGRAAMSTATSTQCLSTGTRRQPLTLPRSTGAAS